MFLYILPLVQAIRNEPWTKLLEGMLYLFAIFIFCFVIYQLLFADPLVQGRSKRNRKNDEMVRQIDASLSRIHERHRFDFNGSVAWNCRTKRFPFQITLQKGSPHEITISMFVSIPQLPSFLEQRVTSGELNLDDDVPADGELQALLKRLRFFDHVSVGKNGVTARKEVGSVRDLENWADAFGGALALSRYLLDYQKMPALQSTEVCPYCKELFAKNESLVFCKECRTVHHRDCWNETGHCTVFGCFNKDEVSIN